MMNTTEELVLKLQTPPMRKLADGWYTTVKHGMVYVTPDGVAWTVRPHGSLMNSVSIPVKPRELMKSKARTSKQAPGRSTKNQIAVLPKSAHAGAVQRTLDELL